MLGYLLMNKIFGFLFSLFATTTFAADSDDRALCIKELKKYHEEKWCDTEERKTCFKNEGELCLETLVNTLELEFLDKKLNNIYKKVIKKADERQQKSIRETQRAWLKYYGLECLSRLNMIEGGASQIRFNMTGACQQELMQLRIKELEQNYCQWIDGGC
ncbi:hypothetical protein A1356_03080 [Methylomonas koyamae]|uniref:Lysozyme inhibitor LprI-like N-terminal domain-containing protein n=2 Tax=Methylomonas koyamae TaxID=702114 RepID=A0AA91D9X0_9GAMM|nr:hypothetical protein A1356_03080 [Methylomonas koyamae]